MSQLRNRAGAGKEKHHSPAATPDEDAAEPTPLPLFVPPDSPLPLDPTGDCGMAEAQAKRAKATRRLRRCIVRERR